MIGPLHDDQSVARLILGSDVPGRIAAARQAADAETAALPERVAFEAAVPAEAVAVCRLDRARLSRQEAPDELAEGAFADETDAGRVALVEYRQAALAGDAAHLGLAQVPNRKFGAGEGGGTDFVQKVTLVLVVIDTAQQARTGRGACVVSGGIAVSAEAQRVGETGAELDLAIAEHVGIRRAACSEFRQEMREHAFAVLGGKVRTMECNAEFGTDAARVLEIGGGGAVAGLVFFPIRHEQGLDLVAGVAEQQCRDRRIDAAGQRDDRTRHRIAAARRGSSSVGRYWSIVSGWRMPAR